MATRTGSASPRARGSSRRELERDNCREIQPNHAARVDKNRFSLCARVIPERTRSHSCPCGRTDRNHGVSVWSLDIPVPPSLRHKLHRCGRTTPGRSNTSIYCCKSRFTSERGGARTLRKARFAAVPTTASAHNLPTSLHSAGRRLTAAHVRARQC